MKLNQIKLSGFKSFVDNTLIEVCGQLVGIVGPNGCGKSNVIDAVRWVLGESSAKQLRGESMTDVIFNGSSNRKPAARASVELVFDNAEGRAGGQWGQYAEISVRRVLTRDGGSSYYINNQQVRRRDVQVRAWLLPDAEGHERRVKDVHEILFARLQMPGLPRVELHKARLMQQLRACLYRVEWRDRPLQE